MALRASACCWIALLAAVLLPARARAAAPAPVVAILEMHTEEVEPDLAPLLTQALQDELARKGVRVLSPTEVVQKLHAAGVQPGCLVGPCLDAYVVPLGTHTGLVISVSQAGNSYRVLGTLIALDSGTPVAQVTDHCDVCEIKEGMSMMDRAADAFAAKAADVAVPAPPARTPVVENIVIFTPPPVYRPAVRWTLLGAGALAAIAGSWMVASHRSLAGAAVVGVGGVCLGGATMLWLTTPRPSGQEAP